MEKLLSSGFGSPRRAASTPRLSRSCRFSAFPRSTSRAVQGRALPQAHRALPRGAVRSSRRGEVVGMTSTIRMDFDFAHLDHTFADVIQGGWLTSHEPGGDWLYGADIGTHPAYRRRGIARALYAARHETVRALGLAGQVTVGMPRLRRGKGEMTAEEYYDSLLRGARERSDHLRTDERRLRAARPRSRLPQRPRVRPLRHRARAPCRTGRCFRHERVRRPST